MYTCPQCKIGLSKQRGNPGVFWSCPSCSGRSATVALLRNNVPGSVVNELWQAARAGSYPRKRACPACSKQMAEVPASGAHGVEYVDVCTVCQFIWFDFGEYDALPVTPQNLSLENKLSSDVKKEVAYHQIKALQKEAHGSDWGQSTTPENWWQWIPGFLGMPVEEDVSCRRIPWVTWILTLMVTTASLIAFLDFNYVAETLGLIPAEADRYGGGTLLTSFFIHGGLLHLIGNMYFFLVFGDNVEERLGICRYAFLLLSATLCGGLFHILGDPASTTPCIGASGGISGVMAYYALKFPKARLGYMLFIYIKFIWIRVPAYALFFVWIALQGLGTWQQLAGYSNVSSLAHLGGAAMGFAFWLFTRKEPRDEYSRGIFRR